MATFSAVATPRPCQSGSTPVNGSSRPLITPIAFPPELVPAGWRTLLYVNPLSGAVGLLRWALVDTSIPTAAQLATSVAAAIVLLLLGLFHFRRREREFADII